MAFGALTRLLAVGLAVAGLAVSAPLNARTPGNVVHSGDPVVLDPNGEYIRISRMNDGALIAGYAASDGPQQVLRAAKSTDNGVSWSHLGEVFRGDFVTHDIDNAFPLQLPSGRVLFAYRNHDRTGADLHYTYFRISISYSDDGGVNYKYLSTVDERVPQGVNGIWEPFLRIARDGSLQVYYSSENEAADQDNLMRVSHDGGQTFGAPIGVSGQGLTSRDGMTGVAPTDNNGGLMCVFENTEDPRGFTVNAVYSSDDGMTWGGRRRLYTPSKGTAGAPQVYNVWGTMVASFMTNEDHDVGKGYDGGDMKVITSTDGGKNWGPSTIVGPSPAHWPGLFNLDPTHFLALYSQDGKGAVSQNYELQ